VRIIIVGGGCIGLGIAGELSREHTVHLFDENECGSGASRAAAGMIAPVMEAEYGEEELLELGLESQELYKEFVKNLEQELAVDVDFRTQGTLGLAFDQPEEAELERKIEFLNRLNLQVDELSVEEIRSLDPRISSYGTRAIKVPSERQIDNRKLTNALKRRCENRGVSIHEHEPVVSFEYSGSTISEVITDDNSYETDFVLICAGAYSGKLDGLKEEDRLPVRPVKGEALSVRLSDPPEVEHVIRTPEIYCVPKSDGRLVIGGTMREEGFDETVTAGAVLDLLHDAYEVLPFIYEQELLETWAGLRPASRDSLPVLGPSTTTDNLGFATGHYRNGILLTPVTVKLISEWLNSMEIPDLMSPFLPSRFQEA
jgi:glycine oxidase